MTRLRCRLSPWITAGAVAYILLLIFLSLHLEQEKGGADLQVLAVTPKEGTAGDDLILQAHGSGFSPMTHLSLALDRRHEMSIVANIPTGGIPQGVAVDGPLVYLASGFRGVQAWDMRRPEHPVLLGSLPTPRTAWTLALQKDLAFLAGGAEGLVILDIADPQNLRTVAGMETGGNAIDVAVQGDRAYVVDSRTGLHLIDVIDPSHPRRVGQIQPPGTLFAIAVQGEFAFVADAKVGMHVVAIGGEEPPSLVVTLPIPGGVLDITVQGDFAYATGRRGLHVMDLRDPRRPRLAATVPTDGTARAITLAGERAYVAARLGLSVFDLTTPGKPQLVTSHLMPGVVTALDLDETRKVAYVCTATSRLAVVDVREPRLAQAKAPVKPPAAFWDVAQAAGRLFGISPDGLQAVDLDHPQGPTVIGSLTFDRLPIRIALAEDRAYVLVASNRGTADGNGIHIIDTTDPRQMRRRGFIPIAEKAKCLAAAGTRLFVGVPKEILIFDVEDADRPRQIGSFATSGSITALRAEISRLYAGDTAAGLLMIDISDPHRPRLLGAAALPWHLQASSSPLQIATMEDTAIMAEPRNGLLIYRTDRTEGPRLVSSLPLGGLRGSLTVIGDQIIVAKRMEILLIDLHDRQRPRITGVLPVINSAGGIAFRDGRLCLFSLEGKIEEVPIPIAARKIEVKSPTELIAAFPPPATPGTYSLHLSNGLRTTVLPRAVVLGVGDDSKDREKDRRRKAGVSPAVP